MTESSIDNTKRLQALTDAYERIGIVYKRISWMDIVDIRRCHPVLHKTYLDCEQDIDKNYSKLDLPTFRHLCEKMVTAWENITYKVETTIKENDKKGMPRPLSHASSAGLVIYREEEVTPLVKNLYCTLQEIQDWTDRKLTTPEIEQRNKAEFNKELGRRFNKQFMIYCDLAEEPKPRDKECPPCPPCPVCAARKKSEGISNISQKSRPAEVRYEAPPSQPINDLGLELIEDDDGLMELDLEIKEGWTES
jgi:hypothetical protein